MTIASKLTQSVRQAKASAANEHDVNETKASDRPTPQASKPVAKPAATTKKPTARKKPEPEAPIVPFPYRRVWPD